MYTPDKQLLELCGKARDAEVSPDELSQLEQRLLVDPDARTFYRRFMQIQSVLERYETEPEAVQGIATDAATRGIPTPPNPTFFFAGGFKFAALAACLGLLLTLGYYIKDRNDKQIPQIAGVPMLQAVESAVVVLREGVEFSVLPKKMFALLDRDVIRTGSASRAVISYSGEETALIMSTSSRMRLGFTQSDGKHIELYEGFLTCDVAQQMPGQQMQLSTPHGQLEVLGTTFVLSSNQQATELAVSEGQVQVEFSGQKELVATGEFVSLNRDRTMQRSKQSGKKNMPQTEIEKFVLIDVDAKQPLEGFDPLENRALIDLAKLPTSNLNIRAFPRSEVTCVFMELKGWYPDGGKMMFAAAKDGKNIRKWQAHAPYYMAGDIGNRVDQPRAWTPEPGDYVLKAVVYQDPRHKNPVGAPTNVRFKVINTTP